VGRDRRGRNPAANHPRRPRPRHRRDPSTNFFHPHLFVGCPPAPPPRGRVLAMTPASGRVSAILPTPTLLTNRVYSAFSETQAVVSTRLPVHCRHNVARPHLLATGSTNGIGCIAERSYRELNTPTRRARLRDQRRLGGHSAELRHGARPLGQRAEAKEEEHR
jgi:hypothetical protein